MTSTTFSREVRWAGPVMCGSIIIEFLALLRARTEGLLGSGVNGCKVGGGRVRIVFVRFVRCRGVGAVRAEIGWCA